VPELPRVDEGVVESTEGVEGVRTVADTETQLVGEEDADVFAPKEMRTEALQDEPSAQSAEDLESDYFRAAEQDSGDVNASESPPVTQAKRTAAIEEEDDYDLGFGSPSTELDSEPLQPATKPRRFSGSNDARLAGEVNDVLGTARTTPRRVGSTETWSPDLRAAQARYLGRVRQYSTSASASFASSGAVVGDSGKSDVAQCVTDPAMLSQTIADFLGLPQEVKPPRRMRSLLNAKQTAERASRQLSRALADGSLTEEVSLQLERTITISERRVAKVLALRAAEDLRTMLDEGKVDFRRAQWLEQAVEKGMVVVVEEAKQIRGLFDQGKLDEEQFGQVRERLEGQHGVLNTEAMRLRGWFEDEEGGGGVFDEGGGNV